MSPQLLGAITSEITRLQYDVRNADAQLTDDDAHDLLRMIRDCRLLVDPDHAPAPPADPVCFGG